MNEHGVNHRPAAATAGMFDGVHRGHQFMLGRFADEARHRGLEPVVFTFARHPLSVIAPDRTPALLSAPGQRADLIRELTGIRRVEIIEPTPELMRATARKFLDDLRRRYGVETFAMGFNNHIGSDRATAQALASGAPADIIALPPLPSDQPVNSSAIRSAIAAGDISAAEAMLGHRWTYRGTVVPGKQLGRTIGFPTANIEGAVAGLLLPPGGVYAVDVTLGDGSRYRGMANIGSRPTVDAEGAPTSFEVNIFGYSGDLYGRTVDIDFLARLRDERRFPSLDSLRRQLEADRDAALKV